MREDDEKGVRAAATMRVAKVEATMEMEKEGRTRMKEQKICEGSFQLKSCTVSAKCNTLFCST